MPRGVAKDFMSLLAGDHQSAKARMWMFIVLAVLLAIPAWWLLRPWGPAVHAGTALLGALAGWLWAGRAVGAYEDSLRGTWNTWMKLAPACENVPELFRKVRGKRTTARVFLLAGLFTLLWALEILMTVLAVDGRGDAAVTVPVLVANALLVGVLMGQQIRLMAWTRSFRSSLDEMVRSGEIGVWGTT